MCAPVSKSGNLSPEHAFSGGEGRPLKVKMDEKNRRELQGSRLMGSIEATRPPVTFSSLRVIREKVVGLTPVWGNARPIRWTVRDRDEEDTGKMTSKRGGEEVRTRRAEGEGRPGFRGDKSQVGQGE